MVCLSCIVLSANVRCLRKKYGMTQKTLAQLLGVESYELRHLESGKSLPVVSSEVLTRLSEVFAIPIEDLIQREVYEKTDF